MQGSAKVQLKILKIEVEIMKTGVPFSNHWPLQQIPFGVKGSSKLQVS